MKKERGITLVVLVITIIILIILATVTINAVWGENGLLTQARETKESAENMVASENEKMGAIKKEYEALMAAGGNISVPLKIDITETHTNDSLTINIANPDDAQMTYEIYINDELRATQTQTSYTTSIEMQNKDPYIPSGFSHTEGTIDTGYVIKDNSSGNEFVWIPVQSALYTAYVIGQDSSGNVGKSNEITITLSNLTREINGITYSNWEEEEGSINDKKSIAYFKNSVAQNCGFYMGRYEMGMPGQKSGEAPTLEIGYSAENISGVPVCIPRVIPWTNIDWSTAKANLESMYNGEVQSAMMNSYARTTTLNWIQDTGTDLSNFDSGAHGNYNWNEGATHFSFKGYYYFNMSGINHSSNYIDTMEAGEYIDSVLIETGADTEETNRHAINNICDLAGNASEWTTEKLVDNGEYRQSRRFL